MTKTISQEYLMPGIIKRLPMADIEEEEREKRINMWQTLNTEWLREIMTSVFCAETESEKRRQALRFLNAWRKTRPADKHLRAEHTHF